MKLLLQWTPLWSPLVLSSVFSQSNKKVPLILSHEGYSCINLQHHNWRLIYKANQHVIKHETIGINIASDEEKMNERLSEQKSWLLSCSYLLTTPYIKWHLIQWTANYFTVITGAVYINMICIIETLHYWRNLETRLV